MQGFDDPYLSPGILRAPKIKVFPYMPYTACAVTFLFKNNISYMKKKSLNTKLSLNKKTILSLDALQQKTVRGGLSDPSCCPGCPGDSAPPQSCGPKTLCFIPASDTCPNDTCVSCICPPNTYALTCNCAEY